MSYTYGDRSFRDVDAIRQSFTERADLEQLLAFERALADAQAAVGAITPDEAAAIARAIEAFTPDLDALREGLRRDGVVPPELVAQLRDAIDPSAREAFHRGATSQDLVDTSLMLRLKRAAAVQIDRLEAFDAALVQLGEGANRELYARTRMQRARPITIEHKIEGWRRPIATLLQDRPSFYPLQLGGPDGTARGFGGDYAAIRDAIAAALELDAPDHHWQTDRTPLLAIVGWWTGSATALGKIAQDILLMTQSEVGELSLTDGGGSSAMAGKCNPVLAERVVAEARFCQSQMNALNYAALHENERSGSAWTLEWMLVPALVVSAGDAASDAVELLGKLRF